MLRHRWMSITLAMLGLAAVASAASASDEDVMPQAKAESEALVKAFNEHKAKTVGSLFTEGCRNTTAATTGVLETSMELSVVFGEIAWELGETTPVTED